MSRIGLFLYKRYIKKYLTPWYNYGQIVSLTCYSSTNWATTKFRYGRNHDLEGMSGMRLGTRTYELCEQAGINPERLEELAGLDRGEISRWAEGSWAPSYDALDRVADELGIPLRRVFCGDDEPPCTPKLTPRATVQELEKESAQSRVSFNLLSSTRGFYRFAGSKRIPTHLCEMDDSNPS